VFRKITVESIDKNRRNSLGDLKLHARCDSFFFGAGKKTDATNKQDYRFKRKVHAQI
jgi:hypothetical protein